VDGAPGEVEAAVVGVADGQPARDAERGARDAAPLRERHALLGECQAARELLLAALHDEDAVEVAQVGERLGVAERLRQLAPAPWRRPGVAPGEGPEERAQAGDAGRRREGGVTEGVSVPATAVRELPLGDLPG